MKVYVGIGQTESGDDVGPYVWKNKPSKEDQLGLLLIEWPGEFEDTDEEFGWISRWNVTEELLIG